MRAQAGKGSVDELPSGRFRARVSAFGRQTSLGSFETRALAEAACDRALSSGSFREPRDGAGKVYFVRAGTLGPIKIGFASDVRKRLRALQTASAQQLRIIGTIDGQLRDEAAMHKQWAHLRMGGEWFRAEDELLDFVRSIGGANELSGDIATIKRLAEIAQRSERNAARREAKRSAGQL